MALRMFDGFEAAPLMRNTAAVVSIASVAGRDGVGRGLTVTNNTGEYAVPIPGAPFTAGIIGIGFKPALTGSALQLVGNGGLTWHLTINHDATGRCQVQRGTAGGVILATATTAIDRSAWHYYEVKFSIADTGGTVVVKEDGVEVINYTGDTRNGGLGTVDTFVWDGTIGGPCIDDLYILDLTGPAPYNDWIGERVIKSKRPAGNGASNAWTGSDGDSTDNYALVDEDPPNTTDYVSSNTVAQRDLYQLSAATGLATVDAVQAIIYASKSDSGARSAKALLRDDATATVKSTGTLPLSTSWSVSQGAIELTDPAGNAWTPARVNAIQAGVETV